MEVKTNRGKRLFLLFLTVVMMFTSMCSFFAAKASNSGVAVLADSNDRRAALIDFAKKKSLGDIGTDSLNNLTYQDLTMLGVFLSNFYTPWSTTIGKADSESDASVKETEDKLVSALVTYCNFEKSTAEALVPMIWSMAETTATPLYVGALPKDKDLDLFDGSVLASSATGEEVKPERNPRIIVHDNESYTFAIPNLDKCKASWYDCLASWTGFTRWVNQKNEKRTPAKALRKDEETGIAWENMDTCLFWVDSNNTSHIVFNAALRGEDEKQNNVFTSSIASYSVIASSLNYGAGMGGNALFSVPRKTFLDYSEADAKMLLVSNSVMYIDCFGDIICDTGLRRYVVVPAAANPYTWYNVRTEDVEDVKYTDRYATAGDNLNTISTFIIGAAESDKKIVKWEASGQIGDDGGRTGSFVHISPYVGSQSLFNTFYWRTSRGNAECDIDETVKDTKLDKWVKKLVQSSWYIRGAN